MKRIRVLLHLDRLGMGGMEKKVVQLAARLNRERFEPVVSYSGKSGPCAAELRKAGIRSLKIVPHPPGHPRAEIAVRQIRDIAPDLFHSFSCSESSDDVVSAQRAGVLAILTGRDNVRHWTSGPVKDWECLRNSLTAFVTPCCEASAKLCRDVEGIPPGKIDVILNGVELPSAAQERSIRQELNLPEDTILAGYAARYEYLKGHEGLISAWWGVVTRHPNVHLVCCGEYDEPRMSRVRQTVAEHSLERHITLLGPRTKMASFYRGLDLYVHSSHSEALSMAILEAMSHGQPVVAFAVGGTPEAVIHDETGILAAPKDDFALRHAMLRLIEDPETRKKFGAAGRQRIEQHFSVEQMVQAYESLYLRLVDRHLSSASPRARLQFTGAPGSPAFDDTTVFLTTTGDDTGLEECIERLRAQTVRCSIVSIDGSGSLPAALNGMHTLCTSPYYVWVTGEMLLAPHAIEHLRRSLDGSAPDVARVLAPLWDHEMGEPVSAIAIHRHAVVQQFPYEDILGCETLQSDRIRAAGFQQLVLSPDSGACLGEFGKHRSPETLFRRWQWSFQRHNRHGHAQWLDPWPRRLLDRYIESRDPNHLYALLGAIAGIAVKTDGSRELDWREADPALHRMRYYFPAGSEAKEHPLATIVIPLLRQKDAWLEQAVRSAAKQTSPCEVIVVLSLRTPPSNRDVVYQLAAQHPNLKILTEEREGFPQSLNTGIRAARTERIGFLLSDDWLEPDCLAECLGLNADIVSTSHSTVYEDGVTPVEGGDRLLRHDEFLACSTHELRASYLTHFLLFRKAALERAGYVDESVGDYPGIDDYHLLWTMLEQGASVALVEKYLYRMRDHGGDRLTLADPAQARRNLEKILCKHRVGEPEYSRILAEHSNWFGRPMNVVLSELRQKS